VVKQMEHETGPDGTEQADKASAAGPVSVSVPSADREVSVGGEVGDGLGQGSGRQSPADAVGDGLGESSDPQGAAVTEVGEGAVRESDREILVAGTVRADPVPTTGEPRVDAALKLLDRLPGLPVSEHPELFEQVHAQLSHVLGELDSGPAGG
jgi:hypothetical protein